MRVASTPCRLPGGVHANDPPLDELVVVVVVGNPRELVGGDQVAREQA